jgi:sugar phosphate isomerase/epimerase
MSPVDGSVDFTALLQALANSNKNIIVQIEPALFIIILFGIALYPENTNKMFRNHSNSVNYYLEK